MDTTPVMAVFDRYCMFCREHRKRLHCLTNYKARNENYKESIEKFLNLTLDRNVINCMYVCEKCINTCEVYSKFKTDYVKNLNVFIESNTDRIPRMEDPYPSALKSAIKISDHSDSAGKQSLETTRDTGNENEEEPLTPIRSCSSQELEPFDHTYSVTSRESGKTYLAGSVNHCETASIAKLIQDKAVRKMLEQIYNALKEMSRRKVFNQMETNIAAETHLLLGVLEEMEQNCPQFLEVLFVILENLLLKNLDQDALEVQDLISNGEGENGAELTYRDDRENNKMDEVFSCTETDTVKRKCMDTSVGEKSSRNRALVKSSRKNIQDR